MFTKSTQAGFSLLEILIVIVIVGILAVTALPYYENAVQSTRATEAVIWWGNLKNWAYGRNMSRASADKAEENANQKAKLKYFTLRLVCNIKEDIHEPCWEAEFHLQVPDQRVKYYLATQKNFLRLVCVPENRAGKAFCQTQSERGDEPDTEVNGQPAYIIRY